MTLTSGITANFDTDIRIQDDLFGHSSTARVGAADPDPRRPRPLRLVRPTARGVRGQRCASWCRRRPHPRMRPRVAPRRKVGDLFTSFMDDRAHRRALGAAAVDELTIDEPSTAVGNGFAVLRADGPRSSRRGTWNALGVYISADAKDTEQLHPATSSSPALGLPDESYYREDKYADIRAASTLTSPRDGCSG